MSKKFITGLVASMIILSMSIFSLWNAFALAQEMDMESDETPLSYTAKNLCKNARANYKTDVAAVRAKGLSSQVPPGEIKYQIDAIKDYRNRICFEAKYGYPPPLTSARQLCKEAKADYRQRIKDIRAVGLSLHLSKEDIKQKIQAVRDYRKQVCKEAKTETGPSLP
ncbi:hypothetical protein HYW83_04720 [Candidatus Peregrinibacteria bacterium]|nr:hypothetical protein [Candidatus Peregrinibacteria bacterium]